MRILFWLSAIFIAYVYAGYPLLLAAWTRLSRRRETARYEFDALPNISIVLATRNEAKRLADRVANLLSISYPAGRRQLIVVADGSTDETPAVLAAFGNAIDLVVVPRGGKAAALNAGVERAQHEILVFADARQTFASEALCALTAPFADPTIGGVTGELVLGCEPGGRRLVSDRRDATRCTEGQRFNRRTLPDRRGHLASSIAEGVGTYWRYEKALRRLESRVGSTLGATGAIYALRRSLWRPLPEDTILDDVLAPMRVVLAGRRVVFEKRAQAFDLTSPDSSTEARRKVRTLAGNFQILALEPRLLIPIVNPVWTQYMSHKVGRLLVPYALLTLMAASIALAPEHYFYGATLVSQCAFYLLAGYGAWLESRGVRQPNLTAAPISPAWPPAPIGEKKRVVNA